MSLNLLLLLATTVCMAWKNLFHVGYMLIIVIMWILYYITFKHNTLYFLVDRPPVASLSAALSRIFFYCWNNVHIILTTYIFCWKFLCCFFYYFIFPTNIQRFLLYCVFWKRKGIFFCIVLYFCVFFLSIITTTHS